MSSNVTVFGTCRVDTLSNYNMRIRNEISYTHDPKEILEVIKFIKYNHVSPDQTITTFRSPMLTKNPIYSEHFKGVLGENDIFVIEICGRKSYKFNNLYIHSSLPDIFNDRSLLQYIEIKKSTDEEVENDILEIMYQLNTKKIIFISHIVTDDKSDRYELSILLEKICSKYNLLFINPTVELKKRGHNIHDLVLLHEKNIYHYNDLGHALMKEIYEEFINKLR